jgi:hypothetical protein
MPLIRRTHLRAPSSPRCVSALAIAILRQAQDEDWEAGHGPSLSTIANVARLFPRPARLTLAFSRPIPLRSFDGTRAHRSGPGRRCPPTARGYLRRHTCRRRPVAHPRCRPTSCRGIIAGMKRPCIGTGKENAERPEGQGFGGAGGANLSTNWPASSEARRCRLAGPDPLASSSSGKRSEAERDPRIQAGVLRPADRIAEPASVLHPNRTAALFQAWILGSTPCYARLRPRMTT